MVDLLQNNFTLIVFLHVISAVVWVGGMISMRYATHQSLMLLDSEARLERVSHALKRLFAIVTPFVIILIVTAVIMAVGLGFRLAAVGPDGAILSKETYFIYNMVHLKEAIWMLMAMNLAVMAYLRTKAQKALVIKDFDSAKAKLGLIGKYMVPVNIALGVIAIYLGVFLRHTH